MDKKYSVDDILNEIKQKKQKNPIADMRIDDEPKSAEKAERNSGLWSTKQIDLGELKQVQVGGEKKAPTPKQNVVEKPQAATKREEKPSQTNVVKNTSVKTLQKQNEAPQKSTSEKTVKPKPMLEGFGDSSYRPYEKGSKMPEYSDGKTPKAKSPVKPAEFKLNIENSFFDDDVQSSTKRDIPISTVQNEKAASGFTRSIPALKGKPLQTKLFALAQEVEDRGITDDYENVSEGEEISASLKKSIIISDIRTVILAIIFGLLFYTSYSLDNLVGLPSFMFPEVNPFNFVAVNIALTFIAMIISSNIIGTGLIAMVSLKPDSDTPIALACFAVVAQGVALAVSPEAIYENNVNLYFAVVVFGLMLNSFGKRYMHKRIYKNFQIVRAEGDKYAAGLITDRLMTAELTKGQNIKKASVLYSCKSDFLSGFMFHSHTEDYGENITKISTPLFLIFNTIISVVSFFLFDSLEITLTVFAALMCICSPVTSTLVGNIPLWRLSKKLTKQNAAIMGYRTLDDFDEVTTVAVDANELFSGGSVVLHGIKPFVENKIDEAIVDAASVMVQANGILKDIFLDMIGKKESLLKEVDNLAYEDNMGLSAWVDGKRVLIGNASLLRNHGIALPDTDYEAKFEAKNMNVVYISNSGELMAMFVLSYHGTDYMSDYLDKLAAKGIGLSVYTTDPNITGHRIEELFGYPEDMITIMSSKIHASYNQTACDREKSPAKIAVPASFTVLITSVCSILSGKASIVMGTAVQLLGMVLGYAFLVFYTLTGDISEIAYMQVIIFQGAWAAITMLISRLIRI